jgi:hypothetical protein
MRDLFASDEDEDVELTDFAIKGGWIFCRCYSGGGCIRVVERELNA